MLERFRNSLIVVFSIALVMSVIGLISNVSDLRSITGAATEEQATSQVTILNFFSISKSTNLSFINFGTVLNYENDINATGNYDPFSNNASLYYITISPDSNVNVDFCIKGNAMNTTLGDVIGLGNYTWSRSTLSNLSDFNNPQNAALSNPLDLSYVAAQPNVGIGNNTYFRFFLDIPTAQQPGIYQNTLYFKGVSSGSGC